MNAIQSQSKYRKPLPARVDERGEMRHPVLLQGNSIRGKKPDPESGWMIDVSSLGCRLLVGGNYPVNSKLQINLKGYDPISATVIWQEKGRVGCRFDKAITIEMFRALTIKIN